MNVNNLKAKASQIPSNKIKNRKPNKKSQQLNLTPSLQTLRKPNSLTTPDNLHARAFSMVVMS